MPPPGGGVVGWWVRCWRALVAECVGTALLVALGVGSCTPRGDSPSPLTHPALAFGGLVTGLASWGGGVSGAHLNPAVTLAAVLRGHVSLALAAGYVAAQAAGAILGFLALYGVSTAAQENDGFGVTQPGVGLGALAAAGVEAVLTGTLVLAVCSVWAGPPDPAAPVKLGLTVAALVYAGGELTGASLNPARSLGPALVQRRWDAQWVYWVGPLGGAALAALLDRLVRPPAPALPAPLGPEDLPLHDKREH